MTGSESIAVVSRRWECCGSAREWTDPRMPASTVWHRADCPTLTDYPLRDLTDAPRCSKCGGSDINTEYHAGSWWEFTNHRTDPWRSDLGTWSCLLTWRYRPVEHLDRRCGSCGFAWLERTADAGMVLP